MTEKGHQSVRPEIYRDVSENAFEVVERETGLWEKLYGNTVLRKTVLLVFLAVLWEAYARWLGKPLLFPTLTDTVAALLASLRSGALPAAAESTIVLLLKGYALGLLLAVVLTAFANVSRIGADLLETLTSMFHPLPSIALLPIAFIWFGLGDNGMIFVVVHAVLWSVALNTHAGFRAVSPTLRNRPPTELATPRTKDGKSTGPRYSHPGKLSARSIHEISEPKPPLETRTRRSQCRGC